MPARDLLDNGYFRVVADDDAHVVRLVRSVKAFPTQESN